MSRVEQLVKQLAPHGVEFKTIAEITGKSSNIKWANIGDEKFQYIDLASVDRVTRRIGDTATIDPGSAPSRAQQIVRTGDVIFATTRPAQMRWAVIPSDYDGQIASTGYCVIRPDTSKVLTNFLAHVLGTDTFRRYIEANQVAGNYPSIPDNRIRAFRVPVPPIEIQRKIVRVLDQFTQLEAELEAELEARSRQYAHYRGRLLAFEDEHEQTSIADLIHGISSGRNKSRTEEGSYPVYGSTGPIGMTDTAAYSGDALLVARVGANAGRVNSVGGKYDVSDNTLIISPKPVWDIRFAFHQLTHMNLNQYAVGGGQPLVTGRSLKALRVAVPPLEEQRRIASVLDKFDALVNDLSVGLPAELAARRRQYNYYRDKLLTFEEAAA